jgi:hypothetical protein
LKAEPRGEIADSGTRVLQFMSYGRPLLETMLTIRIDAATERKLARLARERRTSRSDVVRQALEQLAMPSPPAGETSAYTAVADLVGCFRSGRGDLSVDTGKRLRHALKAKGRR